MRLSEALQESEKHLGQLIAVLEANDIGSWCGALVAAREFEERYTKYVRSRRCCMNCRFCRADAEQECGRETYINDDPAETGKFCGRFTSKYDVPCAEKEA